MSDFKPTIGRWWVVDDPDQQVAGYLDLEPEGLGPWRLTVEGQLAEPTGPGYDTHQTIYGVTPLGKFTLERASTTLIQHGDTTMQQWRGWQLIRAHMSRMANLFRTSHSGYRTCGTGSDPASSITTPTSGSRRNLTTPVTS